MIEGEIAPIDEELQSLAHLVTRQHAIVLCCAHSVAELVEEVARNLGGLGFDVDVVCGAEARSALLGRNDRRDEPTIYVVCVQGTLKEQVLKPLRQALATHGGPNQHLFVAVLDLALPLAMVGQIRRFAEALERPGGKGGALAERRQWRENLGPGGADRMPTRAYRAVDVLERTGSHAVVGGATVTRTGPQAVIGHAKPAKLGGTTKYRAVTGQLPVVSEDSDPSPETSSSRRRRKTHAPKVRVKPIAQARTRRGGQRGDAPSEPGADELDANAPTPFEPIQLEPMVVEPDASDASGPSASGDDDGLREHVPPADIDATMVASWGIDDVDTKVRPKPDDAAIAAAGRAGDTASAPPPLPSRDASPTPRRETVLYVETGDDDAVLMPAPPREGGPRSATARGDTVIGQPPTRFRATPVSMPPQRSGTLVAAIPPVPEIRPASSTTTLVPPAPTTSTARGNTVVPGAQDTATARGETVVAPAPSEASPTARGETVVAPAPRESSPTARGETVVAPAPRESSPTARGETVVAAPRDDASARGNTVVPMPRDDATARGDTVVASMREPLATRGNTVVPSVADDASPTARGETVLLDAPREGGSPTARGETVLLPPREPAAAQPETTEAPAPTPTPRSRARVQVVPSVVDPEPEAHPVARGRSRMPLALGAIGLAAAVAIAWSTGMLGGLRDTPKTAPTITELAQTLPPAIPPPSRTEPAHAAVVPTRPPEAAEPPPAPAIPPVAVPEQPAVPEQQPAPTPAVPETPTEPPAATPVEPAPAAPEATDDPPAAAPSPPGTARPIEPALATAVAQRRLRVTDSLYVTSMRESSITWSEARSLCEKLEIDGVLGFRLPYRRELQAIDVARYLRPTLHWSRTVPDDDRASAYVLEPESGALSLADKEDSAAVVCVRSR